jgi:exosome complex RNA-binding protein Rrp4
MTVNQILVLLIFFSFFFCNRKESVNKGNAVVEELEKKDTVTINQDDLPKIEFHTKEYDFGKVKAGEVVKYNFKFKNTGKKPLMIHQAFASCGCTVPTWTKDPILPGENGSIFVEFNTKGKKGFQNKKINIKANTIPEDNILELKGWIEE